ncbi:MAG: nitroreductase family protein [Mariniphaga sp.]|nr:nitroreductase family protein [Mariniphaga sp.]
MKLNLAIKNRWSPRVFSEKEVTAEMIELLFEAARWAPSAMNEQPWKYFYAQQTDQEKFNKLVDFLMPGNQTWAKNARLLIVSVVKKNYDYKNRPNRNALHDLGAANISVAIQAAEMGLQAHQMAGFDKEGISEFLKLDIDYLEPVTVFAIGFAGNPESLPEDQKKRELAERKRNPLNEFVFKI